MDRALADIGLNFQHVYIMLPTLLHIHHPMLPGYLDGHVPHGICFYSLNKTQRSWLHDIGYYPSEGVSAPDNGERQPITGVYSMGSTSSIGQNANSDLDIWVCHQSWLDNKERTHLQSKCHLLEQWAARQEVNVNFFLIDENRFRHNARANFGGKACGSTQHILLLNEFYSTAVRMGGKRILWNMVPGDKEDYYDEYVLSLYASGALTPNEWLDLGGLRTISAEEYANASLWQLHKNIDSPYKAVLKTLLLEAYSWEYPQTELLAMKIKQKLHDGKIVSFGLDPYCMMLERVTYYLTQINDMTRLNIVHCCFYIKVCEKLSQETAAAGWRREILTKLVKSWGWDKEQLKILDDRANWKIEKVCKAHNELLDAMVHCYNNLIRLGRRNNLDVSANLKDIGVLTQKLYTVFEVPPSKSSMLLNPQISPDLT